MLKCQCQGRLRGARRAGLHSRQNKGVVAVLSPGPLASLSRPLRPVSGTLWAGWVFGAAPVLGGQERAQSHAALAPGEALPGALSPGSGSHGSHGRPSGGRWALWLASRPRGAGPPGGGCKVFCRARPGSPAPH